MRDDQLMLRETAVRDLTSRSLSLRAESANEEERSVEAVIATETPAVVWDWAGRRAIEEVLVAEGGTFPEQIPLLANHDKQNLDSVLGSARGITRSGNNWTARLHFAAGDDSAGKAWNKIQQGHLRAVSIGYRVLEFTDIGPREVRFVAGRNWTAGPRGLRVSTRWEGAEVSLVPIGADRAATIRGDETVTKTLGTDPEMHRNGGATMKLKRRVKLYLRSLGLPESATDEQTAEFLAARNEAERGEVARLEGMDDLPEPAPEQPTRGAQVIDVEAVRNEAALAERRRADELRTLAGADVPAEAVQRAITEGMTRAQASELFLDAMRGARSASVSAGAPAVHARNEDAAMTRHYMAAGLMQRLGMGDRIIEAGASDERRRQQERIAEGGQRFAWMSLFDLCRESVRLTGAKDPMTGGEPNGREGFIRAAVSGGELVNIFTTNVNARLMAGYEQAADTTGGWVEERDVADFKIQEDISLGKTGGLRVLPRGKTAQHADIADAVERYQVRRFAEQFVVDEQDIIDDNLSAMQRVPFEMGQAAARLRPDLVYSILLGNPNMTDGAALFLNARGNNNGLAFGAGNLQTVVTAMRTQQQNGVNLNVAPRVLIVTPALEFAARTLLTSSELISIGGGAVAATQGSRNVIRDLSLELRVDGRLANGVTNPVTELFNAGSATTWFLAADPGVTRTLVVAYLAGTGRAPMMRSFVLDRGQWGIGWDIKHDLGAAPANSAWFGLHRGNV